MHNQFKAQTTAIIIAIIALIIAAGSSYLILQNRSQKVLPETTTTLLPTTTELTTITTTNCVPKGGTISISIEGVQTRCCDGLGLCQPDDEVSKSQMKGKFGYCDTNMYCKAGYTSAFGVDDSKFICVKESGWQEGWYLLQPSSNYLNPGKYFFIKSDKCVSGCRPVCLNDGSSIVNSCTKDLIKQWECEHGRFYDEN